MYHPDGPLLNPATTVPPDWLWSIFSGGYKHLGTEITLGNTHLHKKGVVKGDGGCQNATRETLVFFKYVAARTAFFGLR